MGGWNRVGFSMDKEDAKLILETSLSMVLSLDRIGSSFSADEQEEAKEALMKYVCEWDIAGKASELRDLASKAFDDEVEDDHHETELGRLNEKVACWTRDYPSPDDAMTGERVKEEQRKALAEYMENKE